MLKTALCFLDEDDEVVTKELLRVHWSEDVQITYEKCFGKEFIEAISSILADQIKSCIHPSMVKELIERTCDQCDLYLCRSTRPDCDIKNGGSQNCQND
jgi:hypothetical protein